MKQEMENGFKPLNWKGRRRYVDHGGYIVVYVPEHPFSGKNGLIAEHRLVMENHLGRYLTREEVVHHIDRNRQHNRITNLQLFANGSKHMRFHDELDMSWKKQLTRRSRHMTKELVIRGIKIIAMPYTHKEGFFYIVKNEGSQFDTSFVGPWEHFKKRMNAYTKGIQDEQEFLKLFKETDNSNPVTEEGTGGVN